MPTGSRCHLRFELVRISCNTITTVAAFPNAPRKCDALRQGGFLQNKRSDYRVFFLLLGCFHHHSQSAE